MTTELEFPQFTDRPVGIDLDNGFRLNMAIEPDYDYQPTEYFGKFTNSIDENTLDRQWGLLWGEYIDQTHAFPASELTDQGYDLNEWEYEEIGESDFDNYCVKFWPREFAAMNDHSLSYIEFGAYVEEHDGQPVAFFQYQGYKLIGHVATAHDRRSYDYATFERWEELSDHDFKNQVQHFEDFYRDQWWFVGAITSLEHDDQELESDSLWKIEWDGSKKSDDYLESIFREQIQIVLDQAPKAILSQIEQLKNRIASLELAADDLPAITEKER